MHKAIFNVWRKRSQSQQLAYRVDPEILHKARVRAVMQKKTTGRWLEEAIIKKLDKEEESSKEVQQCNINTGQ